MQIPETLMLQKCPFGKGRFVGAETLSSNFKVRRRKLENFANNLSCKTFLHPILTNFEFSCQSKKKVLFISQIIECLLWYKLPPPKRNSSRKLFS